MLLILTSVSFLTQLLLDYNAKGWPVFSSCVFSSAVFYSWCLWCLFYSLSITLSSLWVSSPDGRAYVHTTVFLSPLHLLTYRLLRLVLSSFLSCQLIIYHDPRGRLSVLSFHGILPSRSTVFVITVQASIQPDTYASYISYRNVSWVL